MNFQSFDSLEKGHWPSCVGWPLLVNNNCIFFLTSLHTLSSNSRYLLTSITVFHDSVIETESLVGFFTNMSDISFSRASPCGFGFSSLVSKHTFYRALGILRDTVPKRKWRVPGQLRSKFGWLLSLSLYSIGQSTHIAQKIQK